MTDIDNPNRYTFPKIKPFENLYRDLKDEDIPKIDNANFIIDAISLKNQEFQFKIKRKDTSETIFNSQQSFVFSDKYLEFTTVLPSQNLFGIGERNNPNLKIKEGIYTLFARDDVGIIEDGQQPPKNVYSSHPMYLVREKSGNFNLVFFKNSSPIDIKVEKNQIQFRAVGGILHFKIFMCEKNAEQCIQQYHNYLGGGHILPPFWAFGFHQSRWGYSTSDKLIQVIKQYRRHGIPLDSIWSDIDFMINKQTFSVNFHLFSKEFFQNFHEKYNINYIPIVDVAVGVHPFAGDNALKKGIEMDIFCKSPQTGKYFKGYVWPGDSYFPDFLHPNSSVYWQQMMEELHSKVNFSGIWIDMNEPANFCNGECTWIDFNQQQSNKVIYIKQNLIKIKIDDPEYINQKYEIPYQIGGYNYDLNLKTLPYHLLHYGKYEHKDVHNIYGLLDNHHTYNTLIADKIKKIYPFILTRSSFPGSGKYAFKWTGDNLSDWNFLRISIVSIVNLGLYGMPFAGADVCGFMGNTQKELCQRWIQLSSLQPFMRNHNHDQAKEQEFYNLGQQVENTAIKNLKLRYQILKHYFMLFVKTNHVGTVYRPLFFEFPDDPYCYKDQILNYQFMLGKELLSTPVLFENTQEVQAYFPQGQWFDFYTGNKITKDRQTGQFVTIINGLEDFVPLFVREGSLIGIQSSHNVQTVKDLDNKFKLICALSQTSEKNKYQCEGNLLNLQNFNDEIEIRDSCDKQFNPNSNCIIDIKVIVNTQDKSINFSSYIENNQLKSIIINSISIYDFPDKILDNTDNENVLFSEYNYSYNINLIFKKVINLSQSNKILINY
ncbi:hypothetical protein IMG5_060920 [Ichthyophthirius multifiliis]|uniref:Alpha-glucosidase n=1 Tax=Ichthyophthirius multifiliis TaxID=5932 RepID=G0QNR2_ICHMU|nr:hypothetical protein IMG5_060920 [Ichthyophthirius multifiliis]EGR33142.1 hypothetical protein IMG5_060920 [Ichthyophthirius multifiliis]|eukprot:XP_004037128.1 hypothetical protein IMG5_060920 [Ichthyophthirius multifiliis]